MRLLLLLIVNFFLFACTNGGGQTLLSPTEFEKKMNANSGQLLDVRTPDEFKLDRIANATNLDIYSASFDAEVNKLDKSKTYYVYCQRGGRSTQAAEKLKKSGFQHVYELDGGILNWEKEGKSVEKTTGSNPVEITLEEYDRIIKSQKLVLIDYSAKWCGPCRKLTPLVEKIGKQRSKDVKVVMIDVDANQAIAQANNIEELPTLAWYKDGKLVLRMIGLRTEKDINETVDKFLKN